MAEKYAFRCRANVPLASKAIVQVLLRTVDEARVDLDLVDAIESRIISARPIPLTGDVRLDPDEVEPLVHELRDVALGTSAEQSAGKLERLVLGARKVPLTDQVRFNRRKALKSCSSKAL